MTESTELDAKNGNVESKEPLFSIPEDETKLTTVIYAIQALGLTLLPGIFLLVGVIINYVKRSDLTSQIAESHFKWQIRTFWYGLLWSVIGSILSLVFIGFIILFIAYIWLIYRVVKGWIRLNDSKPMYAST